VVAAVRCADLIPALIAVAREVAVDPVVGLVLAAADGIVARDDGDSARVADMPTLGAMDSAAAAAPATPAGS